MQACWTLHTSMQAQLCCAAAQLVVLLCNMLGVQACCALLRQAPACSPRAARTAAAWPTACLAAAVLWRLRLSRCGPIWRVRYRCRCVPEQARCAVQVQVYAIMGIVCCVPDAMRLRCTPAREGACALSSEDPWVSSRCRMRAPLARSATPRTTPYAVWGGGACACACMWLHAHRKHVHGHHGRAAEVKCGGLSLHACRRCRASVRATRATCCWARQMRGSSPTTTPMTCHGCN